MLRFLIALLLTFGLVTPALAQQFPPVQLRDEGTVLGQINTLNCVGAGVVCSRVNQLGTLTVTGGAPADPSYLTLGTNATLANERVLTAGTGITFVDAGAGSTLTISAAAGLTGSGVSGTIPKWTGASTLGNSIITESGAAIAVAGSIAATGTANSLTMAGSATGLPVTVAATGSDATVPIWLVPKVSATSGAGSRGVVLIGPAADDSLNANVSALVVSGQGHAQDITQIYAGDSNPGLIVYGSRGTLASPVATESGDWLYNFNMYPYNGSQHGNAAGFRIEQDGAWVGLDAPSRFVFSVGTPTGYTEALRLDSALRASFFGSVLVTTRTGTPATMAVFTSGGVLAETTLPVAGAPADAQYLTLATNATLTVERVLTGTPNQVSLTDAGAGGALTLSLPQNVHTAATPQFAGLGLGAASGAAGLTLASGTLLIDTAANVLEQRSATTGGITRLYNTWTSSTVGEWLEFNWQQSANTMRIKTNKGSGGGSVRSLQLMYSSETARALSVNASTAVMELAQDTGVNASGNPALRLFQNATFSATSGTSYGLAVRGYWSTASTSTMVVLPLWLNPEINFTHATPGAGSYEAVRIAPLETDLPTGQNYLIRGLAGPTGVLDRVGITNDGKLWVYGTGFASAGNYERAIVTTTPTTKVTFGVETAGTGGDNLDVELLPAGTGVVQFSNAQDGAGAGLGTLTNAPAAGDPLKWLKVKIGATVYHIPAW